MSSKQFKTGDFTVKFDSRRRFRVPKKIRLYYELNPGLYIVEIESMIPAERGFLDEMPKSKECVVRLSRDGTVRVPKDVWEELRLNAGKTVTVSFYIGESI